MTSISINIPNEEMVIFKKMAEKMGWSFKIDKISLEPYHESDIITHNKSIDNIPLGHLRDNNHSALDRFISLISHELLSPITELVYDIDFTIAVAEKKPDTFSRRQLISKLLEILNRMMLFKYIISNIEFICSSTGRRLEYSIVKQNKPEIILLDAIQLMKKNAHAKGISISTYFKEMPPLYFDKERMMQVFLTLLKNAIRYADEYTKISISYNKREDGFHEIRFADYGIGIQEKEKESIFDLFHRGAETINKKTRGTGMGLYIAREIMRAHGGDCYVRRLNNPTEFAITLPNKE